MAERLGATAKESEFGVEYWPGRELPEHPQHWLSGCVALAENRVLVADHDEGTLIVLDADTGSVDSRLHGFAGARGLHRDRDGSVVVCRPDAKEITRLDSEGSLLERVCTEAVEPWYAAQWRDGWLVADAAARKLLYVGRYGRGATAVISENRIRDPRAVSVIDEDAFIFVDRLRCLVAEIDSRGRWRWRHGREAGNAVDCLASPEHILAEADGSLTICDTRNNRVVRRAPDGSIVVITGGIGHVGSAPGCLNGPIAAARTTDGALVIADSANGRVLRLDPSGAESTLMGDPPVARFTFQFPRSIARCGDRFLVADSYNNRVAVLSADGNIAESWDEALGVGFFWPRFATYLNGRAFVSDSRNGRLVVRSDDARFEPFLLRRAGRVLEVSDPHTVRATEQGGLTISDTDANRLVHVALDGVVLAAWGGVPHFTSSATPIAEQILVDVSDLHDGHLRPDGSVWLVDTANHRLLLLDSRGRVQREILTLAGGNGDAIPELRWPRAVEPVGPDRLLITDSGNHRVVLTDLAGRLLAEFGGRRGHALGHLADPRFARYDASTGRVFIADYQNHRILSLPSALPR